VEYTSIIWDSTNQKEDKILGTTSTEKKN
jgi:hypothetical protein